MKIFMVQLKNPNHPTGKYSRDGVLFQIRRKLFAKVISGVIAEDKNLKVSIVEEAKDMEILKALGSAPFVKPEMEKPEEKPKEEKHAGPGFFGKITGKAPVPAIPPIPGLPEKKD